MWRGHLRGGSRSEAQVRTGLRLISVPQEVDKDDLSAFRGLVFNKFSLRCNPMTIFKYCSLQESESFVRISAKVFGPSHL